MDHPKQHRLPSYADPDDFFYQELQHVRLLSDLIHEGFASCTDDAQHRLLDAVIENDVWEVRRVLDEHPHEMVLGGVAGGIVFMVAVHTASDQVWHEFRAHGYSYKTVMFDSYTCDDFCKQAKITYEELYEKFACGPFLKTSLGDWAAATCNHDQLACLERSKIWPSQEELFSCVDKALLARWGHEDDGMDFWIGQYCKLLERQREIVDKLEQAWGSSDLLCHEKVPLPLALNAMMGCSAEQDNPHNNMSPQQHNIAQRQFHYLFGLWEETWFLQDLPRHHRAVDKWHLFLKKPVNHVMGQGAIALVEHFAQGVPDETLKTSLHQELLLSLYRSRSLDLFEALVKKADPREVIGLIQYAHKDRRMLSVIDPIWQQHFPNSHTTLLAYPEWRADSCSHDAWKLSTDLALQQALAGDLERMVAKPRKM